MGAAGRTTSLSFWSTDMADMTDMSEPCCSMKMVVDDILAGSSYHLPRPDMPCQGPWSEEFATGEIWTMEDISMEDLSMEELTGLQEVPAGGGGRGQLRLRFL